MRKLCFMFLILFCMGNTGLQAATESYEHVIVSGDALSDLKGVNPDNLTLMAVQGGSLAAIPFQIDQKKPDGTYAYLAGEKADRDCDPTLDENDELVFMAADMGPKAGCLPEGALKAVEIAAGDAAAYLVQFGQNAPRSDKDYVSLTMDDQRKTFSGKNAVVGFPRDAFFFDELRLKTGELSEDILDVWTFRGKIKTKFLVSMNFKADTTLKDEPVGYIDGPVRVLYEGSGFLKLSFLKIDAKNANFLEFYPGSMHIRQDFNSPMNYSSMLEGGTDVGIFMALNQQAQGSAIYSSNSGYDQRAVFDGQLSANEKDLDRKNDSSWFVINGKAGTIIYRPTFSVPEWSVVTKRLIYNENTAEEQVCEVGDLNVGFNLFNMENVEAPRMISDIYCFFPRDFTPGDEGKILATAGKALQTTCRVFQ